MPTEQRHHHGRVRLPTAAAVNCAATGCEFLSDWERRLEAAPMLACTP